MMARKIYFDRPDIFRDVPHARAGDVETSHEAAARTAIGPDCIRMLGAFVSMRALTAEEAGRLAGMMDGHQRASDLLRLKLIERTVERGPTKRNGTAFKCRITDAGLKMARELALSAP